MNLLKSFIKTNLNFFYSCIDHIYELQRIQHGDHPVAGQTHIPNFIPKHIPEEMGKLKLKGICLMSPTLILWNGSEAVLFEVSEVIHTDTYTHLHKNTHTHTITDTKCTHTKVTHTSYAIMNNTIQFIATSIDRSSRSKIIDLEVSMFSGCFLTDILRLRNISFLEHRLKMILLWKKCFFLKYKLQECVFPHVKFCEGE